MALVGKISKLIQIWWIISGKMKTEKYNVYSEIWLVEEIMVTYIGFISCLVYCYKEHTNIYIISII